MNTNTLARRTDPAESHQAAHSAAYGAEHDAWVLLCAHVKSGADGLTGADILDATGKPYSSIGPRRPALVADGLLIAAIDDDGNPVRRGRHRVYLATAAGERYVLDAIEAGAVAP